MKKTLLLGLLFISLNCFAQGTTQKEYNYASKGYADDLKLGKDIIAGYEILNISSSVTKVNEDGKDVYRKTTISKLVRKESKTIAAFILEEGRVDLNQNFYSCIPNESADNEIWQQAQDVYWNKVKPYKCEKQAQEYSYGWNMLRILSFTLSGQK